MFTVDRHVDLKAPRRRTRSTQPGRDWLASARSSVVGMGGRGANPCVPLTSQLTLMFLSCSDVLTCFPSFSPSVSATLYLNRADPLLFPPLEDAYVTRVRNKRLQRTGDSSLFRRFIFPFLLPLVFWICFLSAGPHLPGHSTGQRERREEDEEN